MKKLSILCATLLLAVSAVAEKGAVFLTSPSMMQVMSMSPNGKWACGIVGDGTSIFQGALWNLETGEVTYLSTTDESNAYSVTDDGTVCGGYTDYTLHPAGLGVYVAGCYKDGEWHRLDNSTMAEDGVMMYGSDAFAISADGRVVAGYVQNGPTDSDLAPARWVDGKLDYIFPYEKAGTVYAISRDGVNAAGWGYQTVVEIDEYGEEDKTTNRCIALWTADGVEYLSPMPTFSEAGRGFSPDGNWLVCESFGHKFVYNLQTKEKTELPWIHPMCWGQNVFSISNDGMVLGGENFRDESTGASGSYGYMYDINNGTTYKFDEWLKNTHGVEVDAKTFLTQAVVSISDDGKSIATYGYIAKNGMNTGEFASMVIKLDQEVTFGAPVALKANKLFAVNNVRLSWSAPLMNADNVIGYRIYRDDVEIAEIASDMTTYTDTKLAEGQYTYAVSALYEDENGEVVESEKSEPATVIVAPEPLNKVQNIEYKSANYNDLRLRWNAPASNLPSIQYYDLNEPMTGFGGGVFSFLTAIKLPADMVEVYSETHQIGRVAFYPIHTEAIYTIRVTVDGEEKAAKTIDPATLAYGEVNLIDLDTPVSFSALSDVLVIVDIDASKFTAESNEVVAASYGIVTPGYSDLLRNSAEPEFYSLYEASKGSPYEMKISWVISAILVNENEGVAGDVVLGYDIYRNNEKIASVDNQKFEDNNLTEGEYTYGIVAKYPNGESAPANVDIKFKTNTDALKAVDEITVEAGTVDMKATWNAPVKNDESVVSYAMGINSGKGISLSGAQDLFEYAVAHAYPYSILNWYEGYTIDALRFHPSEEAVFAIALEVNGVDHEFIVLGQIGEEDGYTLNTWNNIKLENPYTIKNGDYIRVKLLCTDVVPGTYPITLDDQPGAIGVSDLYCWNYYGSYSSALSDGGHAKGNWMIGMMVSNGNTELLPVKGYNVVLDGNEVEGMLTEPEFTTAGLNWNDGSTHRIKVNTVYNFGADDVVVDGKQVVFNVKAGVENIQLDFVNVYPNPATAYINVEGAVEKLALYDMNGRLVAEAAANTIDVTALPAGNYLLNISNNGAVRTVKVLVVR